MQIVKALKRILKVIGYAAGALFFLIIIVAGFTQSKFFKDRLRTILVSEISTRLNGTLQLGTIRGNFITGFTVDSVVIYYGEGKFLTTGKVLCRYDPLSFPQKSFHISSLIIEKPSIYLSRTKEKEWVIARLFKSQGETGEGSFDGTVIFDNLELKNASIVLVDSATLTSPEYKKLPESYVNYHQFEIKDLNLKLDGTITRDNYSAHVTHASFYSTQPQFELTHFTGTFSASRKGLSIKDVVIQTSHSYLEIDGNSKGSNVLESLSLPALESDSVQLHLNAKNIDFAELKSFIPSISFLEGSALVEVDAKGKFGDLNLQRLNIQTYKSVLKLAGKVQNLHQPQSLFLDIFVGDSKLDPSDVAKLLAPFNLPAFKEVGQISFFAHYIGKPLDFKSTSTLKTQLGTIEIDGQMNLESSLPKYDVSFKTDKLNLQRLFNDPRWMTSISSNGELTGEGISLDEITARLKLTLDSARTQNFALENSQFQVNAFPHRLEGTATLNARETKITIASKVDFTNPRLPAFESDISLSTFDLSKFLNDRKYQTNLNLEAKLSGSGNTIDNINANLAISLFPSTIRRQEFSQEEITFSLDQHDGNNKRLSLHSSVADAEVTGKFDLDIAATALQQQFDNLVRAIAKHASLTDTVWLRDEKALKRIQQHTAEQRQMDFGYSIDVKNLGAISGIMNEIPFNMQGHLDGKIRGTDKLLSVNCNGTFDELFFGTIQNGFLLHNGTLDVEANDIAADRTLEQLSAKINLTIQSGVSKTLSLDSIQTSLLYQNNQNTFSAAGIIDSTYKISLHGTSSTQPQTFAIDLDSLTIATGHYIWNNEDDIQVRLNRDGIRIMHALMKRNEESASLTGIVGDTGEINIAITLKKFSISALNALIAGSKPQARSTELEGIFSADIHLGGSTKSPIIGFAASAENLSYRKNNIGNALATIQYANQLATIDISVKPTPTDSLANLVIKGILPINLAFSGVDERFPRQQQQHLHILSEHFNMNVLEPLMPEFENLTGNIICDVTITGTPRTPQYSGSLSINDARFTFTPNNIAYIVSGKLEPFDDKIALKNFLIRNVPQDRVNGEASVKGTLTIKDFRIDNFDLLLYGQLLFMSEATRKTIPTMYGTLFAAMDTNGLSLQGTLDRPFLSGNLFVRDANLTFPPTKETTGNSAGLKLTYIVVDDTSKQKRFQSTLSEQFYTLHDTATATISKKTTASEPSLIDRLRYDVNIETQGPTKIRMIFTPSTNEELYAELEGKVNALNTSGTPNIYGEITISPPSYYNFFKKFDASGTLKFTGQWDNPELDIKATYEGVRVKDTTEQKVIVNLSITGKRYEPKLEMGMKVQLEPGKDPVDWATQAKGGDIQSDAISFILTGKFRDELTSKDKEGIVSNVGSTAGTSAVSGITSTFLSGMLTDFLRKEFSFIRSAEVTYRGGNLQESADLRLSGEAFKGYWRFGGRIFNDIGNANVNYQVSLGDVFNTTSIRNLFIELERKVEGSEFEERKLTNAARIYYRISF